MGRNQKNLQNALIRLDHTLQAQRARVGLMQRWLDEHDQRLDALSSTIDAHMARLDALLGKGS